MAEQSVGKLVAELIFDTGDSQESLRRIADMISAVSAQLQKVAPGAAVTQALQQLESQLQQTAAVATESADQQQQASQRITTSAQSEVASAEIAAAVAAKEAAAHRKAADEALRLAQAQARLAAAQGDYTGAATLLRTVLEASADASERLRLTTEAQAVNYEKLAVGGRQSAEGLNQWAQAAQRASNEALRDALALAKLFATQGDNAMAANVLRDALNGQSDASVRLKNAVEAQAIAYEKTHAAQLAAIKAQGTLNTSSGQVQQTLGNLLFLVQDAPYGFRGMANNIDPVVRGFVMLRAETGSTTIALRTLLQAFSGPVGLMFVISTFVALLQIIPDALRKTNKEAKEAADEGLKDFEDTLKRISRPEQFRIQFNVNEAIKYVQDQLKQLEEKNVAEIEVRGTRQKVPAPMLSEDEKQYQKQLQDDLVLLQNMKKATDERVDQEARLAAYAEKQQQVTGNYYPKLLELNRDIKKLEDERAKIHATDQYYVGDQLVTGAEKIRTITDQIAQKEEEKRTILRSSNDIIKENVEDSELDYKTNSSLRDVYREQLNFAVEHTSSTKDRRTYQEKINALDREELDMKRRLKELEGEMEVNLITNRYERERREATKVYTERVDQIKKNTSDTVEQDRLIEIAHKEMTTKITQIDENELREKAAFELKLMSDLTTNEYTNKRAAALAEYRSRLDQVKLLYTAEGDIIAQNAQAKKAYLAQITIIDREEAKQRRDFEQKIFEEMSTDKFEIERRRARNEYEDRKQLIVELYQDETQRKKLLQEAEIAFMSRMKIIQIGYYEELNKRQIEALDRIGTAAQKLGAIFKKSGDEFFESMVKVLDVAIQIAKTIEAANMRALKKEGGVGIDDLLNIFASAASLGFATGGYTGDGPPDKVVGPAHAREVYFEQPITDRYKHQLLDLREKLQSGVSFDRATQLVQSVNAAAVAPVQITQQDMFTAMVDNTPIVVELQSMRDDLKALATVVRQLEIQQPIIFQNLLEGQEFMRKYLPKALEFEKTKTV